jgi:glycosyltransferase involved in cell wall biosynthesis
LGLYIKKRRPAAVILNGSRELKTAGLLAKCLAVPQIIYRRGIPRRIRPSAWNRFFFTRVVTDIIVNSESIEHAIREILALPGCAQPTLIYNGIDVRRKGEAKSRSQRIGVVARLSPEKGVDLAIQAFQEVIQKIPDARLRIIGDGPERTNLENLAHTLNVAGHVEFLGFTDDVFTPLSDCAVLVLPSRWEGFANVLLEAMLLKMPCVGFNNTSANEIIEDGVTGYLIEPKNVRQLAVRVVSLFSHPEALERMGKAGYDRLCSRFTLQRSIEQLERLLHARIGVME